MSAPSERNGTSAGTARTEENAPKVPRGLSAGSEAKGKIDRKSMNGRNGMLRTSELFLPIRLKTAIKPAREPYQEQLLRVLTNLDWPRKAECLNFSEIRILTQEE